MTAVTVPQLSISMEEAKVGRWLVDDGDAVAAGQILVEIETDKATVEIEAPAAGCLRIVAGEGAIVPAEGTLAEVEEPAQAAAAPKPTERGEGAPPPAPVAAPSTPAPVSVDGEPWHGQAASPAARRLARDPGESSSRPRGVRPRRTDRGA